MSKSNKTSKKTIPSRSSIKDGKDSTGELTEKSKAEETSLKAIEDIIGKEISAEK
jgi:hypothetical protein